MHFGKLIKGLVWYLLHLKYNFKNVSTENSYYIQILIPPPTRKKYFERNGHAFWLIDNVCFE